MKIVIRRSAYDDLERICNWIARDSPASARSVARRVLEAVEITLEQYPFMGRRGGKPGTREWVVSGLPYVIVYEIDDDRRVLTVRAIYHCAQRR